MDHRPVRVRMVGLLPAILQPCGAACARPFMNQPVEALSSEERDETPDFVRQNGARAHAIAEQIFRDFGDAVRIEVVGLDSPRGMLLAARRRVGREFTVIVGKDRVMKDPEGYEDVRAAVAEAIRSRPDVAG